MDAQINWFFYRNRHLFPSWFHRLVMSPKGMPIPPAPLNRGAVLLTPQPSELEAPVDSPAVPKVIPFPKFKAL